MSHALLPRKLAAILALAAAYFIVGRAGLSLAHIQDSVTLVWPPTGLALAALLLYGRRMWPGVLLGAFLVNVTVGGAASAALIASGNLLEALLGLALLQRVGFDPRFSSTRDILYFMVVAVPLSAMAAATVGAGALLATGSIAASALPQVWLIWWLGDIGGAVVFTPIVMVALIGTPSWRALLSRAEVWIVAGLLLTILTVSFTAVTVSALPKSGGMLLPFPMLVWAGLRLGPRGAIVAAFTTAMFAIWGTAHGLGPLAQADAHHSLVLLWIYLITTGSAAMFLAGAVLEREEAVAQQLRLEEKLHQARKFEELGVLAGGVAHDFNNLLTVIHGNTSLLEQTLEDPRLESIQIATRRASELCGQLLIYAGKAAPRLEVVDLRALIEEMSQLLQATIPSRITLEQHHEAQLPSVQVDPSQLRQIVMNLIINASEAIGASRGTIRVQTQRQGGNLQLIIEDSGSGMPPAVLASIFDPFFTTKPSGRGLGLSAVRGILEAHQGSITAESTPGVGTRFTILLPALPPQHAPTPTPTPAPAPAPDASSLTAPPGRALVVDDQDEVRQVVVMILEFAGWEIREAAGGLAAKDALTRAPSWPTLVILDHDMPGCTGQEVADWMADAGITLPVLMMSGGGDLRDRPGIPSISKPFRTQELLQRASEAQAGGPRS